jgi:hypothetical protein
MKRLVRVLSLRKPQYAEKYKSPRCQDKERPAHRGEFCVSRQNGEQANAAYEPLAMKHQRASLRLRPTHWQGEFTHETTNSSFVNLSDRPACQQRLS